MDIGKASMYLALLHSTTILIPNLIYIIVYYAYDYNSLIAVNSELRIGYAIKETFLLVGMCIIPVSACASGVLRKMFISDIFQKMTRRKSVQLTAYINTVAENVKDES